MNVFKAGRFFTVMAGAVLIGTMAAQAAEATVPTKPASKKAVAPASPVTVKMGSAIVEEYHGGNPANRTTLLRGGEVAQKAKSADSGKKHS